MASTQQRRPTPHIITLPISTRLDDISTPTTQGRPPTVPHISLTSTFTTPSIQEPGTPLPTPHTTLVVEISPFVTGTPPITPVTPATVVQDDTSDRPKVISENVECFLINQTEPTTSPEILISALLSPAFSPLSSPTLKEEDTVDSINSSVYLTPPSRRGEKDIPPYKAALPRLDAQQAAASNQDGEHVPDRKFSRRNRQRHRCGRQRINRKQDPEPDWWVPRCQVAPTAPKGFMDLCDPIRALEVLGTKRKRSFDLRSMAISKEAQRGCDISRRWSSVEVRTHPVSFKTKRHTRVRAQTASSKPAHPVSQHPEISKELFRSITYPADPAEQDVIRTVREQLTVRKFPARQIETPIITLRRATAASQAPKLVSFGLLLENESGEVSPPKRNLSENQEEKLDAFLVTQSEIDTIMAFLEASLNRLTGRRMDDDERQILTGKASTFEKFKATTFPKPKTKKSPKITSKGVIINRGVLAGTAITVADVQRQLATTKPPAGLQLPSAAVQTRDETFPTGKKTRQNVYEVVRDGGNPPHSRESWADIEQLETVAFVDCSSHSNSASPSRTFTEPHFFKSKVALSKPVQANAASGEHKSIKKWSWSHPECPPTEANAFAPPSSSKNSASTITRQIQPKSSAGKSLTDPASEPFQPAPSLIEDVISFPPLPARKNTIDWWSPLPPLSANGTDLSTYSRNLYDIGLDITCSTPYHIPCRESPPPRFSVQISPNSSFVSLTSYRLSSSPSFSPKRSRNGSTITIPPSSNNSTTGINSTPTPSIVKCHPHVPVRLGAPSTIGSSTGASSGERKPSSALPSPPPLKPLRRVTTVDNKPDREAPMVKVRGPSICPPPGRRSLEGEEDEGEDNEENGEGEHNKDEGDMVAEDRREEAGDWGYGGENGGDGNKDERGHWVSEGEARVSKHEGGCEHVEEESVGDEGEAGESAYGGETNETRESTANGRETEDEDGPQTVVHEELKCKGRADHKVLIDRVTPPLPVKDRVGIYERMTGARSVAVGEQGGNCSDSGGLGW